MESMVNNRSLFGGIYSGKKVLITGHTGFKGSWLAQWLIGMGADVCGIALSTNTVPAHFDLLKLDMRSELGDIRDAKFVNSVFNTFKPEIVFHLAAQPLVRLSYLEPAETFETNVMGTVRVLDACRDSDSVRAIVNITSDKCYENKEWVWGYRENDSMGGYDPYSASKGCAELVAGAYQRSYFNPAKFGKDHNTLLASCRAGNVVGGGDWAADRLVPDIIKAITDSKPVVIRNPHATRPWQHVLEPICGYLLIGQKLLEEDVAIAGAWNFGPEGEGAISVREVAECIKNFWPQLEVEYGNEGGPHEAGMLSLDISKARQLLGWRPVWSVGDCFEQTVAWYKEFYERGELMTQHNIDLYVQSAMGKEAVWTK